MDAFLEFETFSNRIIVDLGKLISYPDNLHNSSKIFFNLVHNEVVALQNTRLSSPNIRHRTRESRAFMFDTFYG